MRKTKIVVGIICGLMEITGHAQNYPWPQNVSYSFGFKPTAESQAAMTTRAQNDYAQWKIDFVTTVNAGGFRRVKYPQASNFTYSASEGIGYGMLLAAYSADKPLFDDLYNYYNLKKNPQGLMQWRTDFNGNCSGGDCNSATDGDEDIAFALLIAHCQWGSSGAINYRQQAVNLINSIMQYEVDLPIGRLRPGEFFGGAHCVDPSYFTIGYYRYFKAATNNANWDLVTNYCLNYFNTVGNTTSGLFRDWSKDDGSTAGVSGGDDCTWREQNYAYDASRIPWRLATDYVWHGTTISMNTARKMVNWSRTNTPISGNATNFRDCMNWNGSGNCGSNSNNPIVGGMATGAMTLDNTVAANVTWANSLYNENINRSDDWFYNKTLRLLYLFLQSGNFWPPDCIAALPVHILSFDASIENDEISIRWNTIDENNIDWYVLERSVDGINYLPIAEVKSGKNSYKYIDREVANGVAYYRLSEKTIDGEIHVLRTTRATVSSKEDASFRIYPNPTSAGGVITFQYTGNSPQGFYISVYSATGTKIATDTWLENNYAGHSMSTQNWPSGIYTIQFLSFDGSRYSMNVVIE